MDRRSLIKRPVSPACSPAGIARQLHARAAVRWRLASSFPKSLDTIFELCGCVLPRPSKEMSGGKFEMSVHAAGELMPAFGVVDGVQNGTVEITTGSVLFLRQEQKRLPLAVRFLSA